MKSEGTMQVRWLPSESWSVAYLLLTTKFEPVENDDKIVKQGWCPQKIRVYVDKEGNVGINEEDFQAFSKSLEKE